MTTEQRNQIEALRENNTKSTCATLNQLRKSIDGVYDSNCFCSSAHRRAFLKTFYAWYDNNYPTIETNE